MIRSPCLSHSHSCLCHSKPVEILKLKLSQISKPQFAFLPQTCFRYFTNYTSTLQVGKCAPPMFVYEGIGKRQQQVYLQWERKKNNKTYSFLRTAQHSCHRCCAPPLPISSKMFRLSCAAKMIWNSCFSLPFRATCSYLSLSLLTSICLLCGATTS